MRLNPLTPLVLWVIVGVLAAPAWAGHPPRLQSRAAIVVDAKTGEALLGKRADEVRPIASMTKLFVAMAVRANGLDLDGWTAITRADAREAAGGSRTRLPVGARFKNIDLLRAMLMVSDNRAPTALGRAAGLDEPRLVAAMNAVAKKLGLAHTHFTCPNGLHGNVSTAREMTIALRAALADDVLRDIMGDDAHEVRDQTGRIRIAYGTTDRPLAAGRYDVIGGKTGFTSAAGYCFVVAAQLAGHEIVMAFMGGDGKWDRFRDFDRVAAWLDRGTRAQPHAVETADAAR